MTPPTRPDESAPRDPSLAAEKLLPLVYEELRRLARGYFQRQQPGHTLQPTALVHEAYLRLADRAEGVWQDRSHFLALAATAMRHILVDHARQRTASKRGGGHQRITLHDSVTPASEEAVDLLALDDVLKKLAALDERKAKVIELRFFAGLTIQETATALAVSHMTVSKDWRMARAWIARELEEAG